MGKESGSKPGGDRSRIKDITSAVARWLKQADKGKEIKRREFELKREAKERAEHEFARSILADKELLESLKRRFAPQIKLLRVHPDDEENNTKGGKPKVAWIGLQELLNSQVDLAQVGGPVVSLTVAYHSDRDSVHPATRVYLKFFNNADSDSTWPLRNLFLLLGKSGGSGPSLLEALGVPHMRHEFSSYYTTNTYSLYLPGAGQSLSEYLRGLQKTGEKQQLEDSSRGRRYGDQGGGA